MKFFIPLDFRYGKGTQDVYSHIGVVYGPYEDDAAVDAATSRLWPNEKDKQVVVFEGNLVAVKPNPLEKPEDQKRAPGNEANWKKVGDTWKCRECDADILGAQVAHSVLMRGTLAGFGECEYSMVGYCPNCEKKPDFHGSPVFV